MRKKRREKYIQYTVVCMIYIAIFYNIQYNKINCICTIRFIQIFKYTFMRLCIMYRYIQYMSMIGSIKYTLYSQNHIISYII